MLGTQRTGPDLSNVGKRQASEVWNLIHLYNPRAVVATSVMPGYPWYFREVDEVRDDHVVVPVPDAFKPVGKTIVAKEDAIHLVRYLQSVEAGGARLMIERLFYYVELVSALCGFDGSDEFKLTGSILVTLAFGLVVYCFYVAVVKMLWPQEENLSHIKYAILDDEKRNDRHEN